MFLGRKRIYKVFFSWQRDTNRNEYKIIESALNQAKKELKRLYGYEIEIDHSTLGDVGMPTIDVTILRKIEEADVFVCDITPVTSYAVKRANGLDATKQVPNSNVLIELGYAMSAIGCEYIIPIAHAGKWNVADLPFDINHKRIYLFSTADCSLTQPIRAIIEHFNKNGKHRVPQATLLSRTRVFIDFIYNKYLSKKTSIKPIATIESTVLFSMRMAKAFPGKRGVVEYTKVSDIKRCLSNLLAEPLTYSRNNQSHVFHDPIWCYRAGSSMHIDAYKYLGKRRFLIGNDELLITRIVAFISPHRYYNQYVYVECDPDRSTGLYPKRDLSNYPIYDNDMLYDVTEEYGIFRFGLVCSKNITREEYDDGATCIMGRSVSISDKSELRVRHLAKYNFVIAAKGSVYNNQTFDLKSNSMLWQMIERTISNKEFNNFMLSFCKAHMHNEG